MEGKLCVWKPAGIFGSSDTEICNVSYAIVLKRSLQEAGADEDKTKTFCCYLS